MKKKRIICIILILIFVSGIVIGAIQLYKQYHEYSEGEDSYTDLEEYVKLPEEPEDWDEPEALPEEPEDWDEPEALSEESEDWGTSSSGI